LQGTLLLALFRLIGPGTYPPGADLRDFCPWSALKHAHQGRFYGIFAPGQPQTCPPADSTGNRGVHRDFTFAICPWESQTDRFAKFYEHSGCFFVFFFIFDIQLVQGAMIGNKIAAIHCFD